MVSLGRRRRKCSRMRTARWNAESSQKTMRESRDQSPSLVSQVSRRPCSVSTPHTPVQVKRMKSATSPRPKPTARRRADIRRQAASERVISTSPDRKTPSASPALPPS